MHPSIRSARPAAVLALALAAALVAPGAATAATDPTPATTTAPATTTPPSPTTAADPTTTSTTTSSTGDTSSTTTSAPTTTEPTGPTTTAPATSSSPTGSSSSSTTKVPSATTAPAHRTAAAGVVEGGTAARYGLLAPSALPATSTDPTLVAAGFLERELAADGHHYLSNYGFPDYGLTIDAVLALDAAGAGQTEATAATAYIAKNISSYISYEPDPAPPQPEVYAGATAKALVLALAQGVDPRAFGGVDLVATLEGREQPSGRFSDQSIYGDYSNLIGQSFAVIGLRRAGETNSAASVGIIRDNQCADGGFSLNFGATPCTSDPDVTAFAVQALLAVGGSGDADAQRGLDYLASVQGADGGVGGSGPTAAHNANSTGLAGQAFLAGGRSAQARAAQAYLRGLQYGCQYAAPFRGGIAYDAAAAKANLAAGSSVQDQDRRATTQALLALAGTPLASVSATGADATAPDLACAAPTTSTSSTTSATSSATSTSAPAPSGAAGGSGGAGAAGGGSQPASATPGPLAFTGADVAATVLAGLVLLLLGAAALVLARRKGVHA